MLRILNLRFFFKMINCLLRKFLVFKNYCGSNQKTDCYLPSKNHGDFESNNDKIYIKCTEENMWDVHCTVV